MADMGAGGDDEERQVFIDKSTGKLSEKRGIDRGGVEWLDHMFQRGSSQQYAKEYRKRDNRKHMSRPPRQAGIMQ